MGWKRTRREQSLREGEEGQIEYGEEGRSKAFRYPDSLVRLNGTKQKKNNSAERKRGLI